VVDVVRAKPREHARGRPFPEGSSPFNLKGNSGCRLAADGGGCHMTDNRKLRDPQVIPREPVKIADRVAVAGAQR
jgi:hypothetical protein